MELQYQGVPVGQEVPFELFHRGVSVGFYRADLIADGQVMVETKTGSLLAPIAQPQLRNTLKAAHFTLGLVAHFGPAMIVKRVICSDR